MGKEELENYLIDYLLDEINVSIDYSDTDKFRLFRGLVNQREVKKISEEFILNQDKYLSILLEERGIIDYKKFKVKDNIFLFKGDITRINTDCIVNAANKYLLGCFIPNHSCIDNAIHTYSGIQLRFECDEIMAKQKGLEKNSQAKITDAYNLPCKKIIHTVGPIVTSKLTDELIDDLRNCYRNVLAKAVENNLKSIALCCISTGEFCFPNEEASVIAVEEALKFLETNKIDIIFNVFKDVDYGLYSRLLEN